MNTTDEPVNASPHIQSGRIRFMAGLLTLLWLLVAARLIQVQGLESKRLSRLAQRQHELDLEIPARPADIVDRNGRLLASSVAMSSLFIDPSMLTVDDEFLNTLAQILKLDAQSLKNRVATARSHRDQAGRAQRFLWVKRRMSDEETDQVLRLDWPRGSFGLQDEFRREYPQGSLAAHVLGLRDIDGRGRGGVEQSLDHLIQGQPGRRRLVRDAMGRIVAVSYNPESEPRRFEAVQLTLDTSIQMIAEKELAGVMQEWAPRAACAIVLDPRNGDVLGMASQPSYSPDSPAGVPDDAWKNQAVSIIFEPGSTFKPFVVSWALQKKVIHQDEVFFCENGEYRMPGRGTPLHDMKPHGHLDVKEILVRSSNIGMAKIGERLTNAGLFEAAVAYGFGRPTGIELPGELPGILRPLSAWNGYSTGSIPMGQELAVTPLQLITAHAALANQGRLTTPRLLHGVQGRNRTEADIFLTSGNRPGTTSTAPIVRHTVSPDVARWLVETPMLQSVDRGTGRKAKLAAYSMFGKTGTAQKLDPQTGTYSRKKLTISFICGAPVHDPRVLVLVVVDEPTKKPDQHVGGLVAAPPAGRIMERTLLHLRVPPDRDPQEVKSAAATTIDDIDLGLN